MRRFFLVSLGGCIFFLTGFPAIAAMKKTSLPVRIENIRHYSTPLSTRVVIDLQRQIHFRHSRSTHPDRVIINLRGVILPKSLERPSLHDHLLAKMSLRQIQADTVRAVLDLSGVDTYKVTLLNNPDRLVIDLFKRKEEKELKEIDLIVIDPGHGGKDPGAIGPSGVMEKDVTLDIALRVRDLVEEKLGKKVLLTREKDFFISLEDRTELANAKGADLFISIHTNASSKRETGGIETYFLGLASDQGSLMTAARENSTSEEAVRRLEKVILADLVQDFYINESLELAFAIQESFTTGVTHPYGTENLGVKRAPFYVLANARMPSILVEVSFITHPREEKKLSRSEYQQAIANALLHGISQYLSTRKVAVR